MMVPLLVTAAVPDTPPPPPLPLEPKKPLAPPPPMPPVFCERAPTAPMLLLVDVVVREAPDETVTWAVWF